MLSANATSQMAPEAKIFSTQSNQPPHYMEDVKANGNGNNQQVQLNDWIQALRAIMAWEDKLGQLKSLLSEDKYIRAVTLGEENQVGFDEFSDIDCPYLLTVLADFNVHYAKALIYTGEVEKAITLLNEIIAKMEGKQIPKEIALQSDPDTPEGRRWNLVLGQAYNHLGYAYWIELGYYGLALQEFRAALPYFCASGLEEELANTEDNMGRVYALLGQPKTALSFINYVTTISTS